MFWVLHHGGLPSHPVSLSQIQDLVFAGLYRSVKTTGTVFSRAFYNWKDTRDLTANLIAYKCVQMSNINILSMSISDSDFFSSSTYRNILGSAERFQRDF